MNIASIDLNLLVSGEALLLEGGVTQAAKRTGVTQSAMSHALTRLRTLFGDPLLVRTGNRMVLTPRAEELLPRIVQTLDAVRRLVTSTPKFNPKTVKRTFRIATTDYGEMIILPKLVKFLKTEAPGVDLLCRAWTGKLPATELVEGRLDLAIAAFREIGTGFFRTRLFDDKFVCLVSSKHSLVGKTITMEDFTNLEHVLISPRGELKGIVDELLSARGLERRHAVGVANFLTPGLIVAESEMIVTLPRRLALRLQEWLPLTDIEPPMDIPGFQYVQVWHERQHQDLGHKWFRQVIAAVCKDF